MRAVLKYPGAKNRLAKWICEYIPEHRNYVEPFLGSAAVFFNKRPAYLEILNDLDNDVVNFFTVLRDCPDALISDIWATPYSRTVYNAAYKANGMDPVERARLFAIKCWMGFGCGNRWKNGYRRGLGPTSPNPAKAWSELPETLIYAAERLKNAQIENTDAINLIKALRGKETFIYCDPPYLMGTRKKYLYNNEMVDSEHERLLDALLESSCKVMISGYENQLYDERLKSWRKVSKKTTAECSLPRTETIWMNY